MGDIPSTLDIETKCAPYTPVPGENPQIIALKQCSNATACYNAKTVYNSKVEIYNRKMDELDASDLSAYNKRKSEGVEKENRWISRTQEFESFRNHGISQDFEIHWGWWDWGKDYTSSLCAGCAKGELSDGWWDDGEGMAKNIGVAWQDMRCKRKPGPSLHSFSSYENVGDGGNNAPGRKWWTCRKNQTTINSENSERDRARPIFTEAPPVPRAKINLTPTGNTAIACCANIMNTYGDVSEVSQSCEQNIEQVIQMLKDTPVAPVAPVAPVGVVNNSVPQPSIAETKVIPPSNIYDVKKTKSAISENKDEDEDEDNKILFFGIGGISVISLCCCFILMIALLMTK